MLRFLDEVFPSKTKISALQCLSSPVQQGARVTVVVMPLPLPHPSEFCGIRARLKRKSQSMCQQQEFQMGFADWGLLRGK